MLDKMIGLICGRAVCKHGLLSELGRTIVQRSLRVRMASAEIVVALIDHDVSLLLSYILAQVSVGQTSFLEVIAQRLIDEPDVGMKAQLAEVVHILLESDVEVVTYRECVMALYVAD